jgi:FKBP-type peptidyl-prolyl cis-trans isomerase SlyD
MKIGNNTVVSFQYLLRNDQQEAVDSSLPDDPLVYLHGNNDLIAGLERALQGKGPGDEFSVVIEPTEGYGDPDPELIQQVNAEEFSDVTIEPGMQLEGEDDDGNMVTISIDKIEGDQVTVNMNHPLAGETLHFDIKVESVREASNEEIEHGHPHDDDDHAHDDHDH